MTRLETYNSVIEIFKRDDKSDAVYRAHYETIKDIVSRSPLNSITFQSWIPMVVAQEDYPLPDNLFHLIHPIRLLEGSATGDSGYPMEKITKEEYDRREPNPNRTSPDTDKPTAYCIFSNSILTTPLPDSTDYLLELNWGKVPVEGTADSSEYALAAYWDEVIKWGILWRLYLGLGMTDEASTWMTLYNDPKMGLPAKLELDSAKDEVMRQVKYNDL